MWIEELSPSFNLFEAWDGGDSESAESDCLRVPARLAIGYVHM